MKFSLIMEQWRKHLKELDGADKLDPGFGGVGYSEPGNESSEDYPEQEQEYEDPGLDADGVPNMLKRPPKHSIIIGNPKGKGTKSDPRGIFINGEFLGEDSRWILGKNSDNFYKKDKNWQNTETPNPIYRQTHYGSTELIKTIKDAIEKVNNINPEIYAARFAKMLLGNTDSDITKEEMKYGKALMGLGFYPKETQKLYIEDLGLAPFFTDIYGNTFHGGRSVAGHGSHRTGEDADLGFYMLPGKDMTTMFPKNEIPWRELTPRFRDAEDANTLKIKKRILTKTDKPDPLYRTLIQMGGLGPSKEKIRRKNPIILSKKRLDALVDAYDPNSKDGYSKKYHDGSEEGIALTAAVGEIRNYLSGGKLVVRSTRRKDPKTREMGYTKRAFLQTTIGTMDMERTWTLVSALFESGLVKKCIIDNHLHLALKQACKRAGGTWPGAKLFHWPNHKNHIHISVDSKNSKALGKKLVPELTKGIKKWYGIKSVVKDKSAKGPNWVEDFYDEKGYSTSKVRSSEFWKAITPEEWRWNKSGDGAGLFDEIMDILEPGGIKALRNLLGIELKDKYSRIYDDAMKEMEKFIREK